MVVDGRPEPLIVGRRLEEEREAESAAGEVNVARGKVHGDETWGLSARED